MITHRYGKPVHVWVQDGIPTRFCWNNVHYPITEVLSTWKSRDHWWGVAPTTHVAAENERCFYRVRCSDQRVFDLYFDLVASLWVLDMPPD